jgi:hypothetical protein
MKKALFTKKNEDIFNLFFLSSYWIHFLTDCKRNSGVTIDNFSSDRFVFYIL